MNGGKERSSADAAAYINVGFGFDTSPAQSCASCLMERFLLDKESAVHPEKFRLSSAV